MTQVLRGGWWDRLVVDAAVSPPQPVIKGTPIFAEDLVRMLDEGLSGEHLLRTYPNLTPDDIQAVRHFARVPTGLRQAFGAWAEDANELDEFLRVNREDRQIARHDVVTAARQL